MVEIMFQFGWIYMSYYEFMMFFKANLVHFVFFV